MSVTCTNGAAYQVALGLGNGTGATTTTRYMTNGANKLGYTLYRDSNRTLLWGQSVGTDTLSGTGTGAAATVNVYGRVAIAQTAIAGAYQDTVVVTVSW
jgi:spore coat protein U-like protein